MKERHITLSFLISGHIDQDIVVTDPTVDMDDVIDMLNNNDSQKPSLLTTLQNDGEITMIKDGELTTVGYVADSEPEAEYFDFEELGQYETETEKSKPFNMTYLAAAGAVGEFIYEPDMSTADIIERLVEAGNSDDHGLAVERGYENDSAAALLYEITQMQKGLNNLMQAAYDAGKAGKEIV